ncbi:MAG TPA: hypothetical protein VET48_10700, partial [Steroidobacteraceae bacterium]|nr:hypothetical protein [Steroidobacteraceae bacterium]
LSYVNNASLETAGVDAAVTHTLDIGRFGSLRNSIDATYQTTYDVNGVDRLGSRNATVTGGSFSIPWRATLRSDWKLGAHSVQSVFRYTDSYHNDAPPNAGTAAKTSIESYIQWDLAYTYGFDFERLQLHNASASLGINNVLNTNPPYVPDFNHTLFSIYDYSGRHIWLRLKTQF